MKNEPKIKYCYFNGKIIPTKDAKISLNNFLVIRGFGAFDFLRTYNGKPFLLKEHFHRFCNSAKMIDLKPPITQSKFRDIITTLLKKNGLKDANARIIFSSGSGQDHDTQTFFILLEYIHHLPASAHTDGIRVNTYEYQRNIPEAKTTDYLIAIKLQNLNKKKGITETIYKSNGKLLEATTSNFFVFKGNTLITPKKNVLMGVTRDFVIDLAKKHFKVKECDIKESDLEKITEAFITATNKEIAPIVKIDGKNVGNGKIGKNTAILMDLFQKETQKH